jgi:mannosyltransferase OCH1-like enzyme
MDAFDHFFFFSPFNDPHSDGYAYWIQQADSWKYMALFMYGGVYADLDVQVNTCLRT